MTHKLGACAEPNTMIVKVQVSLFNSRGGQRSLLYNEDKTVLWEEPIDESTKRIMRGRKKAYFYAHMCGTVVSIGPEAEAQPW